MNSKETMVGDIIKVVIAEKYSRDRSLWVAYPLLHGPVMLLKGDDFAEGDVINARVSGVASERMVYGIVQK
jgi:hypothetical protein